MTLDLFLPAAAPEAPSTPAAVVQAPAESAAAAPSDEPAFGRAPARCSCTRPLPMLDEDGGPRCLMCGHRT